MQEKQYNCRNIYNNNCFKGEINLNKKMKKVFISSTLTSLVLTTTLTLTSAKADAGKVTRLGAESRYATSSQVATNNWINSDNVVLVSGEGYADAVSASVLAKTLDAPILLTSTSSLSIDTKSALDTLNPKNIYVIGGEASVPQSIRDELKESYNLVELSGKNRYETNAAVANELVKNNGIKADNVIIVSGEGFSDALSAALIAAVKGEILLLSANSIESIRPAADFIKSNKPNVTVIGTKNVLNNDTYTELQASSRIDGGSSRFDTNLRILDAYKSDLKNDKLYFANASGNGYADALVASVLAGKYSAPLVLIDSENSPDTAKAIEYINNVVDRDKTDINAVGGTSVIPNSIINSITNPTTENSNIGENLDKSTINSIENYFSDAFSQSTIPEFTSGENINRDWIIQSFYYKAKNITYEGINLYTDLKGIEAIAREKINANITLPRDADYSNFNDIPRWLGGEQKFTWTPGDFDRGPIEIITNTYENNGNYYVTAIDAYSLTGGNDIFYNGINIGSRSYNAETNSYDYTFTTDVNNLDKYQYVLKSNGSSSFYIMSKTKINK